MRMWVGWVGVLELELTLTVCIICTYIHYILPHDVLMYVNLVHPVYSLLFILFTLSCSSCFLSLVQPVHSLLFSLFSLSCSSCLLSFVPCSVCNG